MLELLAAELRRGEWSLRQIAHHCGVSHQTVRNIERELSNFDSHEEDDRTIGADDGTTIEAPTDDLTDLIEQQPEVALTLRQDIQDGELAADDLSRDEIEALGEEGSSAGDRAPSPAGSPDPRPPAVSCARRSL